MSAARAYGGGGEGADLVGDLAWNSSAKVHELGNLN
jgi:hypothetical protein